MAKKKRPVEANNEVEVNPSVEVGYCIDCKHYILGGQCGRTGKITGALNEKPCFKTNTL